MKKTILILVAIVAMIACGKSDSNGTGGGGSYSTGKFSPPAWIQGSWFKDNTKQYGYAFKANDFCQITMGATNCFMEKDLPVTDIKDQKTNQIYKISYKISSYEHTYMFEKMNNNEIKVTHNGKVQGNYHR